MQGFNVSKSTSTATATATTTSITASRGSQPESAVGQHQGSFVGRSTTFHTPESMYIPADDQYAGLRLLAEISASRPQIDPFEALATHQTVSIDDANTTMVVEKPKPSGGQKLANKADQIKQWIMDSGNKARPFKCGYEGCGRTYTKKVVVMSHIARHIRDSQYRCYDGACTGAIRYSTKRALTQHIHAYHTFERPYDCNICGHRFRRLHHLKDHKQHVHTPGREKKPPKLRKK